MMIYQNNKSLVELLRLHFVQVRYYQAENVQHI